MCEAASSSSKPAEIAQLDFITGVLHGQPRAVRDRAHNARLTRAGEFLWLVVLSFSLVLLLLACVSFCSLIIE